MTTNEQIKRAVVERLQVRNNDVVHKGGVGKSSENLHWVIFGNPWVIFIKLSEIFQLLAFDELRPSSEQLG